jgi:hypothetical protein
MAIVEFVITQHVQDIGRERSIRPTHATLFGMNVPRQDDKISVLCRRLEALEFEMQIGQDAHLHEATPFSRFSGKLKIPRL